MITLNLRPAEINHLVGLLLWEQEEGSYYGNKEQYQKRTKELLEKLTGDKE